MSGKDLVEVELLPPADRVVKICQGSIYCGFWRRGQYMHWRRLDFADNAIVLEDFEGVFVNETDRTTIPKG